MGTQAPEAGGKGMAGSQHDYIRWLLEACAADTRAAETVITGAAIDQLATEFHAPLHIQEHCVWRSR